MWNSAAASNLLLSFPYHVFFFLSSTPATTRLYASDFFIITVAYMLADSHISVMGHYKRKDLEIFSSSHNIELASERCIIRLAFLWAFFRCIIIRHDSRWWGWAEVSPIFFFLPLGSLGFHKTPNQTKKTSRSHRNENFHIELELLLWNAVLTIIFQSEDERKKN